MNEHAGPRPYRIGLNMLFLRPGQIGGGETYARGLLDGFKGLTLPYRFLLFLGPEAYPTFAEYDDLANFERVLCDVSPTPAMRHVWEQLRLPSLCREHEIDLLHSLANVTPFRAPCPTVVTIHDLLYKVEPQQLSFLRREVLGRLVTASAKRCDLILTVSHTSEAHIIKHLHVPSSKIHVTPEGPGQSLDTETRWEEVQRKYDVATPYFLTVGTATHKRLDRIVDAVEILRAEHGSNVEIVATSPRGDAPPSEGVVRHFGYVPSEDLASLYRHAVALICFSDMEGFGLTALEAMALGTPVVASNAAALPEILGDGGIIVEHGDSRALARAMWRIANDQQLHGELRQRGLRRVANFSWLACAAETARAYALVLEAQSDRRPTSPAPISS